MHTLKQQYSNEVLYILNEMCKKVTDNRNTLPISQILNVSKHEALMLIDKIIIAIPDSYFYNANQMMRADILTFISKNIFFFQIQEHIEDDYYPLHFVNFVNSLIKDISCRYYN